MGPSLGLSETLLSSEEHAGPSLEVGAFPVRGERLPKAVRDLQRRPPAGFGVSRLGAEGSGFGARKGLGLGFGRRSEGASVEDIENQG